MSNLTNQTASMQLHTSSELSPDVQNLLDDLDRRSARECEAVLVGWQGPSAARARLIEEVEARYRKQKGSLMRRLAHPFAG